MLRELCIILQRQIPQSLLKIVHVEMSEQHERIPNLKYQRVQLTRD